MDAKKYVKELATAARAAAAKLAVTNGSQRDTALLACAKAIRDSKNKLQTANEKDLAKSDELGLTDAMVDRLRLSDERVEGMAAALEQIAAQTDPVGATIEAYNRPNGLRIEKRRVPIGVVGIIFESRPNVTADAAGLCLKSGNACILRGGKEALNSNLAIAGVIQQGLSSAGLDSGAVTMIDNTDHTIVPAMGQAEGLIDLIIPRGGCGLIRAITSSATIPVIKHYSGNCHVYIHEDADEEMARRIVLNAKCQRPGVCNAAETLLIHSTHIQSGLAEKIVKDLLKAGVELRGCDKTQKLSDKVKAASEEDWREEYLDLILAVKIVDGLDDAVAHINNYSSAHTEAIVTESLESGQAFVAGVDSSSVMVNASTRFSDGGEYGLGAEVGISTDKLHARGPMGAADLTTYKWIVTGQGHIRE